MIGGDQSYGLGGYSKTPIEAALPVYMDAPTTIERPDLALVYDEAPSKIPVIDCVSIHVDAIVRLALG